MADSYRWFGRTNRLTLFTASYLPISYLPTVKHFSIIDESYATGSTLEDLLIAS
jgi:hypothetical protein